MSKTDYYIGIDLGGTNIKAGLVNTKGEVIDEREIRTEAEKGPDHVLDRIGRMAKSFQSACEEGVHIAGLGVGVPGQVDTAEGIVQEAPNLPGWKQVKVRKELKSRVNIPASVDNDANLAALGEFAFGAGRGIHEMLMVTLGTGVGGGLILGGRVYHGAMGGAGEFGHMVIERNGPVCNCGRRGCIEAFIGTRGLLQAVKDRLEKGRKSPLSAIPEQSRTPKDISEAAESGDALAREVLREAGDALGVALGSVANLLNIERVVVGGGVAKAGDLILNPAREAMKRTALAVSRETVSLVPALLGNRAGLTGASRLAMLDAGY
jgi:glucokinase